MEWLSKSTKRLLAEMSAGIIFYNVILVILAVLLLPKVSYRWFRSLWDWWWEPQEPFVC